MPSQTGHDIIVIGSSAGGVQALIQLVSALPVDLPASVFIVQHMPRNRDTVFHRLLGNRAELPVKLAEEAERFQPGTVYLAPPDRHLILRPEHIHLGRGPRENHSRPAIDPLFRSAAAAYSSRVAGVVLTGMLDDGAAGLADIKQCGGIAIVQDPEDAAYPEMPWSALAATNVDYVAPLDAIPSILVEVANRTAPPPVPVPDEVFLEVSIAEGDMQRTRANYPIGPIAPYSCPECGGTLVEMPDPDVHRYRCRVGHAFTDKALLDGQTEATENMLWAGLRVIQEQIDLLDNLMQRARASGRPAEAEAYNRSMMQLYVRERRLRDLLVEEKSKAFAEQPDNGQ